jgi:hypothetical protein
MKKLQMEAKIYKNKNIKATQIQSRLYRGPAARKRAHKLLSIRIIQKYYRGHYARSKTNRVWKTFGTLSKRPKPTNRKASFFGAPKLHLFSSGKNNWELKDRMGNLTNFTLYDLGIKNRNTLKKLPIRPVFFDRKEQNHRLKMKKLKQLEEQDRQLAGIYLCKKCLQRGKYPGHMCCCHIRGIICRNCSKNQRSLKINGRPKTLICQKRKILERAINSKDKEPEPQCNI